MRFSGGFHLDPDRPLWDVVHDLYPTYRSNPGNRSGIYLPSLPDLLIDHEVEAMIWPRRTLVLFFVCSNPRSILLYFWYPGSRHNCYLCHDFSKTTPGQNIRTMLVDVNGCLCLPCVRVYASHFLHRYLLPGYCMNTYH